MKAALLLLGVVLAHLWLADELLGRVRLPNEAGPARFEIAFVHEMQPAAAPVAARPAAATPRMPKASTRQATALAGAATAASAPDAPPAVEVPAKAEPPQATASLPAAEAAAAADTGPPPAGGEGAPSAAVASGPVVLPQESSAAAAPASAPTAALPPFEWPLSTRLSFRLTGNYRGPVEGQAQVEWLRRGERYQVHLEVSIGPHFAPLVSRRMTSDGDITAEGLSPTAYFEETRVALARPRRRQLALGPEAIRLADGREVPRPSGVQDSASQFVQMIWWFTTQPERLQPGRGFVIPLALPARVEPWTYDVLGVESLHTPLGVLDTVHVKPRRAPRPGGDLVAESWIAPTLQYMPVRIVIRQDEETYVDLLLDRAPLQAASEAASAASR